MTVPLASVAQDAGEQVPLVPPFWPLRVKFTV